MLNFKNVLNKSIGIRIKEFRTRVVCKSQENFAKDISAENPLYIDRFHISNFETGNTKKSDYLMSSIQIEALSRTMGCSPKELVFGNEIEKTNLIKLILLAIIMNGEQHCDTKKIINPIIDTRLEKRNLNEFLNEFTFQKDNEDIYEKIKKLHIKYGINDIPKEMLRGIVEEGVKWYEGHYSFFADPVQFEKIDCLMNSFDKSLEVKSNLLIKLLLSNVDFASDFMSGLSNLNAQKNSGNGNNRNKYICDFMNNHGNYGGLAIDWKEIHYYSFINAFNEMWKRNHKPLVDYFEQELFDVDLMQNGLKGVDDMFFHSIITNPSFENILYNQLNQEQINSETMLGHNISRSYLQSAQIRSDIEPTNLSFESGYNLYKYNYDINQINECYLYFKNNQDIDSQELFLFINSFCKTHGLQKE